MPAISGKCSTSQPAASTWGEGGHLGVWLNEKNEWIYPHLRVAQTRMTELAQRFPQREMGVMLVSDLHRAVGRPLFAVPAFAEWANSITDLVLYEH